MRKAGNTFKKHRAVDPCTLILIRRFISCERHHSSAKSSHTVIHLVVYTFASPEYLNILIKSLIRHGLRDLDTGNNGIV